MTTAGYGLLVVCAATAAMLIALLVLRPRWRRRGGLLRYMIAAGVSATVSSLMYLVHSRTDDVAALVSGDVAMVLAPGLAMIGLGALEGRTGGRIAVVTALAGSTGVVSATTPLDVSLTVKVIVLAILCILCALAARRPAIAERRGSAIITIGMLVYAAFCVARAVVGWTAGWESELYTAGFGVLPTTVIGAALVLLVGVATLLIATSGSATAGPRTAHARGRAWSATVRNFSLVRTAFGPVRASEMTSDLLTAVRDLDPLASQDHAAVRFHTEVERDRVETALRDRLWASGWTPGEIGLLVVTPPEADA
ncbi:MAG: hypothetical protein PGN24_02775 [Microbacterium arborescens]